MEAITLKMEKNLLKKIDNSIKNNGYSTRTEFIRESIRNRLSELEKQEAIRKLEKFRGSLKGKAKKNDEEVREIMEKRLAKRFNSSLN